MNSYELGKLAAFERFALMDPARRRMLAGGVGGAVLGGLTDMATAPEEQGHVGPALRGALMGGALGLGAGAVSNQLGARWGEPQMTVRKQALPQQEPPQVTVRRQPLEPK